MPNGRKTLIVGVGNLLLQDEGVGVHVAQELQKKSLPPGVQVIDGGLAGLDLLYLFQDASKVLLIDAADMNLESGEVRRFTPEEIKGWSGNLKFSSHDVGLLEVLDMAKALGCCPAEVVIIGIQPKEISWGIGLTPKVEASVPKAMETVFKEIDPRDRI